MNIQMTNLPSPKELDRNSPVKIDEWVELGSERHYEVDDNPALTKKWFLMLSKEPVYIHLDNLGRCFCFNAEGQWTPYHCERGNRKYGIRVSKKAAN